MNLMGPPLSWRPPDVADAMSEQLLRLQSFFSFKNAEAGFANHRSERPLSLAVLVARITRSGARAIVDFRISRGLWIFTIADTVVSFFLEV